MPPAEQWEALVDYLIEVVHQLHCDRYLPKYQFERHVDALVVPFLPEIMERRLGGSFKVVASEFPLKKVEGNKSTNADALLHQNVPGGRDPHVWWLFELKTDQLSVKPEQLEPYARACERRMSDLVRDLEVITEKSKLGEHKYQVVRQRLDGIGGHYDAPIRLVYLAPEPVLGLEGIPGVEAITFADLVNVELDRRPEAWRLVRDHLLAPIIGR